MSPANGTQSRSQTPRPLEQRLLAYALGGGALALVATPAGATPILSGIQNISVASGGPTAIPQNQTTFHLDPLDGTSPEFVFGWDGNGVAGSQVWVNDPDGATNPFSVQIVEGNGLINFAAGSTVGDPVLVNAKDKYPKYTSWGNAAFYDPLGNWEQSRETEWLGTQYSSWAAGSTGYLGFRFFDQASDYHFGWMEVSVPVTSAAGENATVVQWAYESDAYTPITIPEVSVPEIDPASGANAAAIALGGLALLEQQLGFAAGAAGLRAWRKRRQALAA